jgi:hypothetical protein
MWLRSTIRIEIKVQVQVLKNTGVCSLALVGLFYRLKATSHCGFNQNSEKSFRHFSKLENTQPNDKI